MAPRKQLLCIEGNVGVGKTTLLQRLAAHYAGEIGVGGLAFLDEPVEMWTKCGALNAMYDGTLPVSTFQMLALKSRGHSLRRALRHQKCTVAVCERSVWTDAFVFASAFVESQQALSAYGAAFEMEKDEMFEAAGGAPDVIFVYLDADVDACAARVAERSRGSETAKLSIERLNLIKKKHDELFYEHASEGLDTVVDPLGRARVETHRLPATSLEELDKALYRIIDIVEDARERATARTADVDSPSSSMHHDLNERIAKLATGP